MVDNLYVCLLYFLLTCWPRRAQVKKRQKECRQGNEFKPREKSVYNFIWTMVLGPVDRLEISSSALLLVIRQGIVGKKASRLKFTTNFYKNLNAFYLT